MPKLNIKTVDEATLGGREKDELSKICKRSGVHPGGTKEALIARIKEGKTNPVFASD
ncbi:hypothetical protein LCGC14_1134810 [marine sediment metagenome]|uniref:SAP domain-containing protein n=1 Tax=marine sediment metagenome TaxID=412755 RepID=A0A0F9MMZ3_9ZZZZ